MVTVRKCQDKENVWEVDIRILLPSGETIRERREAPVSGKAAAQRWAQAREHVLIKEGKAKRDHIIKEVPTLNEFAPRFIEGYVKANQHKPSGVAGKESILRHHLRPRFGTKRLNAITTEDVQQLKVVLGKKSAKTINNILSLLKVLLRTAVEWKVIEHVPCAIGWMKTAKTDVAFHDFDAFARLVAAAHATDWQTYLVVLLGGEAGLRCGEIMALEWKDVDVRNHKLCVARSEWKGHVTLPKGGRIRYVPMTSRLLDALVAVRHRPQGRVLCNREGESLTQKAVQGLMKRVARKANVKPGVHILRHTFCSHLAMRGAPARAIQDLAGHMDLTTTQRYMHLTPAALDRAIALLEAPPPVLARGATGEAAGAGGQNSQTYCKKVVEAAGVEPASESASSWDSTCVSASVVSCPA